MQHRMHDSTHGDAHGQAQGQAQNWKRVLSFTDVVLAVFIASTLAVGVLLVG